ncbi:MAG: phenylalanine--tRNA ligase subunit beta [Planctomycetes bacterium]|jgi:phenylalanyl-tRNA synthetase beta chain|nr:phenylalanine--tRNA ligase subunit beta [Phycisphaerae bacterium]NBB95762.1 phenylalanine--tRNA ligase subunit beta [Planctomycetota bacterium]
MEISLNWLSDYVDVNRPAAELADVFMRLGFPVEDIKETDSDIVLDVEVTSNRPDLLGHLGVARELAAALGTEFRPPAIDLPEPTGRAEALTRVTVETPELCPRYTARVIRNVKVGPSPSWLVEYLETVGLRSVNNVVDATNFVLMEYSQPLHSFDYDTLAGNRIVVRRPHEGETLVSIDETPCKLTPEMCIIADADKPVAIAGVMGGLNTEVTEATTSILLESAQFDPLTTRRTSRALGLMSESNYRFERGVDPVRLDEASQRACQLIIDLAGGELAEGVVDVWAQPYQPPTVELRAARTTVLLGIDVPADRQREILDRLGLQAELDGEVIRCRIPSHRPDLTREADLIEEVARIVGYDEIPTETHVTHRVTGLGLCERVRRMVIGALNAAGYSEAVTFSFVDAAEAKLFGHDEVVSVDPLNRRSNNTLRPTLLASLLRATKNNQDAGNESVSLFELAAVFPFAGPGKLPAEHVELAIITTEDLRDLRGAIENVLDRVVPGAAVTVEPKDVAGFEKGISAEICIDGEAVGVIGRVSGAVADHYDLQQPTAAARLPLDALQSRARLTRTASELPTFPPVRRDLSVVVDESVTWGRLAETIAAVDQPMRADMEYVTTYRGKQLGKGRKSMTVTLEYRSPEGTLRGEDVDEQVAEVVAALKDNLSAELRA